MRIDSRTHTEVAPNLIQQLDLPFAPVASTCDVAIYSRSSRIDRAWRAPSCPDGRDASGFPGRCAPPHSRGLAFDFFEANLSYDGLPSGGSGRRGATECSRQRAMTIVRPGLSRKSATLISRTRRGGLIRAATRATTLIARGPDIGMRDRRGGRSMTQAARLASRTGVSAQSYSIALNGRSRARSPGSFRRRVPCILRHALHGSRREVCNLCN